MYLVNNNYVYLTVKRKKEIYQLNCCSFTEDHESVRRKGKFKQKHSAIGGNAPIETMTFDLKNLFENHT